MTREPRANTEECAIPSFIHTLSENGLRLERGKTATLQVNMGLKCNQACRHCHLSAGPDRRELMTADTVDHVLAYINRSGFNTIDITGGAPELNPHLADMVTGVRSSADNIMLRCNLSVLADGNHEALLDLLQGNRVMIVASFPAVNADQTDAQRGGGVFEKSIKGLRRLNDLGYGDPDTGLKLNLVSNPSGAFLPANQAQAEKRFRDVLGKKYGIRFDRLLLFGNVPLGRFRQWLILSGNYTQYIRKLFAGFNPCAVSGLMCRSMVSVSWDGYLYDCDFNLAAGLPMGGRGIHVTEMPGPPEAGRTIVAADHCYTCTAGAGFT